MCWNVSIETIAKMLTQTNTSELEVLIVNKACIHSRVCVVLGCFRKKKIIILEDVFNVNEINTW